MRFRIACTVAVLLVAAAAPAAAQPATEEWRFKVSLDGLRVGEHRYLVTTEGAARTVRSDATFRLRLLLVDAYAWEQHVEERWSGDCLVALDSRTVEQGRSTRVHGRERGDAFVVDAPDGEQRMPRCPMTFAWWNPRVLDRPALLNVQSGVPTPVTVEHLGRETLAVHGATRAAVHHRVRTARNTIDVWYSPEGDWLALRTRTREGHVLAYDRI